MDIRSLPISAKYGPEGHQIELADVAGEVFRNIIPSLIGSGLIEPDTPRYSFGFAMAVIDQNERIGAWNDYQKLTLFVIGWGDDTYKVIANAVRKLRFSARTGLDSYEAVGVNGPTGRVNNPVDSVELDGSFAWGDFPYGGAVFLEAPIVNGFKPGPAYYMYTRWLLGAVSGFSQQEDAALAATALQFINLAIEKAEAARA